MHLTVIAKSPVAGAVKTRLCPPCTNRQAAEIAAAALLDTLDGIELVAVEHRRRRAVRTVLLLDGEPGEWVPLNFDVVAQQGSGLGERLANGFEQLGPGVIVGMDTPGGISGVGSALQAIDAGVDAIGLASDGGYWAIALHCVDRRVFDDVPMSTPGTGLAQLRRLHHLGRPVRLLAACRDLDDIDDLRAAATSTVGSHPLPGGRLAVAARRVLAELPEV